MNLASTLTISAPVLDDILEAARRADRHECMGLLAADPTRTDREVISAACLLPAEASFGHAEADPQSLWSAAQLLRGHKLAPVGIWHSHGALAVYHSATDDRTVVDFLPAMAEWNLLRAGHAFKAPIVPATDEAALPLDDGRWIKLTLLGPKIPGQDAHERVAWSRLDFSFDGTGQEPQAILRGSSVDLVTDGVCLSLGIPEGSHIHCVAEERQPVRIGRLYSLVVNRRGDKYAELLTVHELGCESTVSKRECAVEVVDADALGSVARVRLLGV